MGEEDVRPKAARSRMLEAVGRVPLAQVAALLNESASSNRTAWHSGGNANAELALELAAKVAKPTVPSIVSDPDVSVAVLPRSTASAPHLLAVAKQQKVVVVQLDAPGSGNSESSLPLVEVLYNACDKEDQVTALQWVSFWEPAGHAFRRGVLEEEHLEGGAEHEEDEDLEEDSELGEVKAFLAIGTQSGEVRFFGVGPAIDHLTYLPQGTPKVEDAATTLGWTLVLEQRLHLGAPVVQFRIRGLSGGLLASDPTQELTVVYLDAVCAIDEKELRLTLLERRQQARGGLWGANESTEGGDKGAPLPFRKWSLPRGIGPLVDGAVLGVAPPGIFSAQARSEDAEYSILAVGMDTCVSLLRAPGGAGLGRGLSALVTRAASRVGSAVMSLTRNLTWQPTPPSSPLVGRLQQPAPSLRPSDGPEAAPGVPASFAASLRDTPRKAESLALAPRGTLAAVTDSLGRVLLIDTYLGTTVRVWKGYRDASCAWLQVPLGGEELGLWLAIYAPRRGVVEVWQVRHGPRVAAVRCGEGCCLLETAGRFTPEGTVPYRAPRRRARAFVLHASGRLSEVKALSARDKATGEVLSAEEQADVAVLQCLSALLQSRPGALAAARALLTERALLKEAEPERKKKGTAGSEEEEAVLVELIESLCLPRQCYQALQMVVAGRPLLSAGARLRGIWAVLALAEPAIRSKKEGAAKLTRKVGLLRWHERVLEAYLYLVGEHSATTLPARVERFKPGTKRPKTVGQVSELGADMREWLEESTSSSSRWSYHMPETEAQQPCMMPREFLRCFAYDPTIAPPVKDAENAGGWEEIGVHRGLHLRGVGANTDFVVTDMAAAGELARAGQLVFSNLVRGPYCIARLWTALSLLPLSGAEWQRLLLAWLPRAPLAGLLALYSDMWLDLLRVLKHDPMEERTDEDGRGPHALCFRWCRQAEGRAAGQALLLARTCALLAAEDDDQGKLLSRGSSLAAWTDLVAQLHGLWWVSLAVRQAVLAAEAQGLAAGLSSAVPSASEVSNFPVGAWAARLQLLVTTSAPACSAMHLRMVDEPGKAEDPRARGFQELATLIPSPEARQSLLLLRMLLLRFPQKCEADILAAHRALELARQWSSTLAQKKAPVGHPAALLLKAQEHLGGVECLALRGGIACSLWASTVGPRAAAAVALVLRVGRGPTDQECAASPGVVGAKAGDAALAVGAFEQLLAMLYDCAAGAPGSTGGPQEAILSAHDSVCRGAISEFSLRPPRAETVAEYLVLLKVVGVALALGLALGPFVHLAAMFPQHSLATFPALFQDVQGRQPARDGHSTEAEEEARMRFLIAVLECQRAQAATEVHSLRISALALANDLGVDTQALRLRQVRYLLEGGQDHAALAVVGGLEGEVDEGGAAALGGELLSIAGKRLTAHLKRLQALAAAEGDGTPAPGQPSAAQVAGDILAALPQGALALLQSADAGAPTFAPATVGVDLQTLTRRFSKRAAAAQLASRMMTGAGAAMVSASRLAVNMAMATARQPLSGGHAWTTGRTSAAGPEESTSSSAEDSPLPALEGIRWLLLRAAQLLERGGSESSSAHERALAIVGAADPLLALEGQQRAQLDSVWNRDSSTKLSQRHGRPRLRVSSMK